MPSSYSPTRGSDLDKARELLGDTAVIPQTTMINDADALHSDAHILSILDREGFALGVSYLAHELRARFAQDPTRIGSQGDTIDLSNLLVVWTDLAKPWLAHIQEQAAAAALGGQAARAPKIGLLTAGAAQSRLLR